MSTLDKLCNMATDQMQASSKLQAQRLDALGTTTILMKMMEKTLLTVSDAKAHISSFQAT